MKISVVVPSYNGWDRLGKLCEKVKTSFVSNNNVDEFEIIIVDDGSETRSANMIKNLRSTDINIKGVFLKKNYGQQFATLAGLRVASGDFVITVDDDLSHDPENFAEFISLMKKDKFDVVFGIPKNSRHGFLRKSGSGIRDIIFDIFFRKPKGISVSSFRILNRNLVNMIISDISEYRYLSVEILKHTRSIGNKIVEYKRVSGNISRYSFFKLTILAFSLIRCSHIFPEKIRKSKVAAAMEWKLI